MNVAHINSHASIQENGIIACNKANSLIEKSLNTFGQVNTDKLVALSLEAAENDVSLEMLSKEIVGKLSATDASHYYAGLISNEQSAGKADGVNILTDITTDARYPKYKTPNGTIIQLNGLNTKLPTGDTLQALIKLVEGLGVKQVLITGGSEKTGHSENSFHYKNQAIDIAGKKFNNLSDDKLLHASKEAGFTHIVYEDFPGDRRDHWHIQIGEGNGMSSEYSVENNTIKTKKYK